MKQTKKEPLEILTARIKKETKKKLNKLSKQQRKTLSETTNIILTDYFDAR